MASRASSQLVGANFPSPRLPVRRRGVVSLSGEWTHCGAAWALQHRPPLFCGASAMPATRSRRPSFAKAYMAQLLRGPHMPHHVGVTVQPSLSARRRAASSVRAPAGRGAFPGVVIENSFRVVLAWCRK